MSIIRRVATKAQRIRVLLAGGNNAGRAEIERGIERVLGAAGDYAEIECVSSTASLLAAFARDPAEIVIIDDETVVLTRGGLIEPLRQLPGGDAAELLALVQDQEDSPGLPELATRELPKPINLNALATVIGRMGVLIAQRRNPRPATPPPVETV